MADTLQDIGAKMANVMFNLAQQLASSSPHTAALMDDIRKQWYAAVRATPPSPSTAPMCERKTAKLEEEGYAKTGYVLRQPGKDREVVVSDGGAVSWFTTEQWNWLMFNRDHIEFQWPKPIGALASRPAEVDDEGLPPLPKMTYLGCFGDLYGYTAEQYRQGQRDAVAADRARRGSQS